MSKIKNRGYMLLEILVSIVLMSIGLLGILAFQLKSGSLVRDAEYRGVVALYAESLAAGMRTNPILSKNPSGTKGAPPIKSWVHYKDQIPTGNCTSKGLNVAMTQQALATEQACVFKKGVSAHFPKNAKLTTLICFEEDIAGGSINDSLSNTTLECGSGGTATVIKMAWVIKNDDDIDNTADSSINVDADGNIINAYQLFVGNSTN